MILSKYDSELQKALGNKNVSIDTRNLVMAYNKGWTIVFDQDTRKIIDHGGHYDYFPIAMQFKNNVKDSMKKLDDPDNHLYVPGSETFKAFNK